MDTFDWDGPCSEDDDADSVDGDNPSGNDSLPVPDEEDDDDCIIVAVQRIGQDDELRIQIWHSALSDSLPPALYAFRKRPSIYSTFGNEKNLPETLPAKARIRIPLAAVNREARYIALKWAEAQRPRVCTRIEE
ncbi:hypothetical protein F4777DRAFT_584451 [Nemania sp. FL0916]|nr:hypothetical protein F4777DRAFT_584451 [Nemania sp. FL0916]